MSKFLDNIGLGHLIDLIKTALSGKQNTLVSGTTIKTINGTSILGSDSISIGSDGITGNQVKHFAPCSTAASTDAKIATCNYGTISSLTSGLRITVYFSNRNTADNPTLNINSKGAKNIYYNGSQITTGTNKSLLYGMVDLVYYSNRWNIVGFSEAGVTAQETLVSGTNIKTINSQSLLGSGDITINSGISGTGVTSIVALTESEYDALATKDSATLYIVVPDPDYGDNYVKISNATGDGTVLEVGENLNMSQNPILYGPNYEILSTTSGIWFSEEAGRYWYYFPTGTQFTYPQYMFDESSQYKPYVGLGYSYSSGN